MVRIGPTSARWSRSGPEPDEEQPKKLEGSELAAGDGEALREFTRMAEERTVPCAQEGKASRVSDVKSKPVRLIEVSIGTDEDPDVSTLVNEAPGAVIAGDSELVVWVSKSAGALDDLSMERRLTGILKEQLELALSDSLNVLGKTGEQKSHRPFLHLPTLILSMSLLCQSATVSPRLL